MPTKITSRYTPLTYDEITKPLIQATEAHMALEDTYATIQDKASEIMAQASMETDPLTYNKLKSYATELRRQADTLATNGLQTSSRQALLGMRRLYGQDIVPIENAVNRRQQLAEEQRKAYASNPYLRHQRSMSDVSLDELVANPMLDYGNSVDLSDITKRAANYTKALGQLQVDTSPGRNVDKYMKEYLTRQGFTEQDIQNAVDGKDTPLGIALKNLYRDSGAEHFNESIQNEIRGAIEEGARMGVGQVHTSLQQDRTAIRADQLADENRRNAREDARRAEERNWALKMKGLKLDSNGNIIVDPNSPFVKTSNSATPVVGLTDSMMDWDPSTKSYIVHGDNSGARYRRNAKDSYSPIIEPDFPMIAFDVDDDFDGSNYFNIIMTDKDFLGSDGKFTGRVTKMPYYEALTQLPDRIKDAVKESGIPTSQLTVIKVRRNRGIDDDYFVIKTSDVDQYIDDALEARGDARVNSNKTLVVGPGTVR